MSLQSIRPDTIQSAIAILRNGGLVGLPTETVYGLAADATNAGAVAKIFAAKNRPSFNPLIAHFADLDATRAHVDLPEQAIDLATEFWPGPLTIVAPFNPDSPISSIARNGAETLAVRVPQVDGNVRTLLSAFPNGLVAPSANPSGRLSPTTAQHVADGLGDAVDLILDAGPCGVGLESTILDVTQPLPRILRHGGLSEEALSKMLGVLGHEDITPERIAAPGQLKSHYSPTKPVWLNFQGGSKDLGPETGWLGFGHSPGCTLNLSAQADVVEAAANLFDALARLDADQKIQQIVISAIPSTGIGRAINDRLDRASYGNGGHYTDRA